ncbi:MAG: hypothetical protein ABI668_05290 [Sphingorhabdus sp.]
MLLEAKCSVLEECAVDIKQIEHGVDLRLAKARTDAENSLAHLKIKKLHRSFTFRTALLLLVIGVAFAVSPLAMNKLLLEDKMASRLTPAAIGATILGFSAIILVTTNVIRKIFRLSFRRSLTLACVLSTGFLLTGSIWLYSLLVAQNAAGSHHLVWVCALMIGLGVPSGWSWSYGYRRAKLRQQGILWAAQRNWRALRKSMIQNEVDKQRHAAKMAKWAEEDAKWKSASTDRERLNYQVQYMKS